MIKKTQSRILLLLACSVLLYARPLSPEEVFAFARDFFPQKTLQTSRTINNSLYLYDFQEGGFLLLSSNDAFPAVLGFSESGHAAELPPAFLDICAQYQREILDEEAAQEARHASWDNDKTVFSKKAASGEITPLISSTWNQEPYYNYYFPNFTVPNHSHQRAYAGCVAVAAGQLMRLYQYPKKGVGYREYYSNETDKLLCVEFDTSYYDWEIMPDSLCNRYGVLTAGMDQVREVAQLLFQIAVSLDMDLKPDGSSSTFEDLIYSLVSYFDYSPEMQILQKEKYDSESWRDMLLEELEDGHPLIYSGQNGEGHAFLCDGYRALAGDLHYFHINWGWGGAYDGWFLLSALTAVSGYDYSGKQQAIFNVRPNSDAITRLAYSGFEGMQSAWSYEGAGFINQKENSTPDVVYKGTYAYVFDGEGQRLISPKIRIPDSDAVEFSIYAKMLNSEKRCEVLLSQSDTSAAAFSEYLGTIAPSANKWQKFRFNLSDYQDKDVYITLRYLSSSGYILLDEFCVSMPKSGTATAKLGISQEAFLQNRPNPFNSSTKIVFHLPKQGDVQVDIYDLYGRRIHSLFLGAQEAGSHTVTWDASGLSSGVYLGVLKQNNKILTSHKILLLK